MLFPVAGFISIFSESVALDPVLTVTFNRIPLLKEMVDEVWAKQAAIGKASRAAKIRTEIRRVL